MGNLQVNTSYSVLKILILSVFIFFSSSSYSQPSLEKLLNETSLIELPYKMDYIDLDTIKVSNYKKMTDSELSIIFNSERSQLFEVIKGVSIDYFIIGKVAYGDEFAIFLFSETKGGLMTKSIKNISFIKFCGKEEAYKMIDFSYRIDFKHGGSQTMTGYLKDKYSFSSENGYYIYDTKKYKFDFKSEYQFNKDCFFSKSE